MGAAGVTVEFLDAFADAWNRHDVEAILAAMTPDGAMQTSAGPEPWGARSVGHAQIRSAIEAFFRTYPDARWNGPEHFVCGDRGVTQWVFTATGAKGGVEAHGCDLFTFRDGRIAVKDSYRKQPAG